MGFIVTSTNENLLLWERRANERTKSGMIIEEYSSNQFQSDFFSIINEGSAGIMMDHKADEIENIYLALCTTDSRKQQNGLASLVSLKFNLDPYSGASVFLF